MSGGFLKRPERCEIERVGSAGVFRVESGQRLGRGGFFRITLLKPSDLHGGFGEVVLK